MVENSHTKKTQERLLRGSKSLCKEGKPLNQKLQIIFSLFLPFQNKNCLFLEKSSGIFIGTAWASGFLRYQTRSLPGLTTCKAGALTLASSLIINSTCSHVQGKNSTIPHK